MANLLSALAIISFFCALVLSLTLASFIVCRHEHCKKERGQADYPARFEKIRKSICVFAIAFMVFAFLYFCSV